MAASVPQQSANDLWADAAKQLSDEDRQYINFSRPDKLNILAELHADAERSKRKSIKSRWKYTRKSGETVIIRDVFEKVIRWVDTFKEIGDVAVQYDPAHAALPWAAVRFVLQVATNDSHGLELVIEGLARIAELICRYAVTEALYIEGATKAGAGLEKAVVKLYANILGYLCKARRHYQQGTAKRIGKSVVSVETQLEFSLEGIRAAEEDINQWMTLVDKNESARTHTELVRLLTNMDAPLRRMNDNLKNIHDHLQVSERIRILTWLSPEPYKKHHKLATEGVLPGTGQWLLSDPLFKKWKNESASSMLWLHGIPGTGKSKLVSIVIEDALETFKAGNSPQPVFFYCLRSPAEPARSDPKAILASLARQLSSLEPSKYLFQPAINVYKEEEAEGFPSGQQLQLDESLLLIMQLIELYPQTTVIVDAMDECNPTTRLDLLLALKKLLQHSSSLVKIFVSSRDDQDIAEELRDYPNFEIDSRRNSGDIARFVKEEVQELVRTKKLLRHTTAQTEMKEMITEKVIKGADGMFRWASLKLQHLCLFTVDADIQNSLDRLPPELDTLYSEIYDVLSTISGELQATVFKNILRWLLCAQRTLHADEFLAMISTDPRREITSKPFSKEFVLDTCNNFVVFDSQLDTFRFAHLSVREFLEKRPDYDKLATNSLVAEFCLWSVLSRSRNFATKNLFQQLGLCAEPAPASAKLFHKYTDDYWAIHCKLAGRERKSDRLRMLLQHILCNDEGTSSLVSWSLRVQTELDSSGVVTTMPLYLVITSAETDSSAGLFVCCVFDFEEQIEDILGAKPPGTLYINRKGRSHLQVAAEYGSCATLACLITKHWSSMNLPIEMVEAAAANEMSGQEVIALFHDQRGADVSITEQVVEAAANNSLHGKEVMALLLDQRGPDVKITEEVLVAAARNNKEVLALLLDQRGAEVIITEEVVKAAAGNSYDGKGVMALLLDQRGPDVKITEEVLVAAARNNKEVLALLLDQRGLEVVITEEVVKAAAGNYKGKEVMALLLDRRREDVVITKEVVKAAAGNYRNAKEVMALLLDRHGVEVTITEEVVKAAVGNLNGKDTIALLLDRRGAEVTITEEVLKVAAQNYGNGMEVMALLLDRHGAEVTITEEVVKAAVGNRKGKEVMALLLDQRGADVAITEEVVKAAARNRDNGKEIMALLLEQRGADVAVTEQVVKAAAGNRKEVLALLLDHRGADVAVTEQVVKAAAGNRKGKEVMALLLDQRGAEVVITEEVVKAAAGNTGYKSEEVMALLLNQRGAEIVITEEVVKAAAGNTGYDGKKVMALLLDQRGAEVVITEAVLVAAADNTNDSGVIECLRGFKDLEITERMIEAAATSGQEETLSLLAQWAGTGSVTHDWVCITQLCVAAKTGHAKTVHQLIQQGTPPDMRDIRGTTPLWHAASRGHADVVQVLLATNAVDVNAESIARRTPIFWTAANGHVEVVELLLTHGARQDYTDEDGRSPLAIAQLYNQGTVADILSKDLATKSAAIGKEL